MENMVVLNAKGIIAVYSMLISTHLRKDFSLSEIMKFRDALDADLIKNGIPVRCGEFEEFDLFAFWDVDYYTRDMKKAGSFNAYDPDTQIMDVESYKLVVVKDVRSKILEPLKIEGACLRAFFKSII